jgi:hypothetical protein
MATTVTFAQMYACLLKRGPATVVSSRGTRYTVEARPDKTGARIIIGCTAKGGKVHIHKDCWGDPETCAGTRTGGLLNGNPSLYDWYFKKCGKVKKP